MNVSRETGLGWPASPPVESSGLGWETTTSPATSTAPPVLPEPGAGETAQGAEDSVADAGSPLARIIAAEGRRRRALSAAVTERPAHTRILTVANQKGGVGKTTSVVNLGVALAQAGMRVLVLDMDPQGNASTALGVPHHAEVAGVYDVLVDDLPLAKVVQESSSVSGLWCAPATIDLAGAEIELVPMEARESRLSTALSAYLQERVGPDRLDFVLIDCPPSLGLLTVNAFVAAGEVLIPIQCEYYALEGVSQLLRNIELIQAHLNPALTISTVLLTMYDARTRLSWQVAEEVRSHFAEQTLKSHIPRSVRISEAPSHAESVMTYDPHSTGALSYREAAVEMIAARPRGPQAGSSALSDSTAQSVIQQPEGVDHE